MPASGADAAAWSCPSCGTASEGPYCARCGERRLGLDGRALASPPRSPSWLRRLRASLQALASPSGRLTRDWNAGKRVGYLSPLSLLLWTNVAFFFVQSASGVSILSWPLAVHLDNDILGLAQPLLHWKRGHAAAQDPVFATAFQVLEVVHAKSLVILMVPLLALAPFLTARRRTFAAYSPSPRIFSRSR